MKFTINMSWLPLSACVSMWLGNSFHISLHHIQISPCLTFPSTSIISFTFNLLSTCLRKRNVLIFSKINLTTMSPPTTNNFRICSNVFYIYLLPRDEYFISASPLVPFSVPNMPQAFSPSIQNKTWNVLSQPCFILNMSPFSHSSTPNHERIGFISFSLLQLYSSF